MKLSLASQAVVFVFGSNNIGRHGKGAALAAKNYFSAKYGKGEGPQGQSYAIPTKVMIPASNKLSSMSLDGIGEGVKKFLEYAASRPDKIFIVSAVGCGLANNSNEDVAPFFKDAPNNCFLPHQWNVILDRMINTNLELINDINMFPEDFESLTSNYATGQPEFESGRLELNEVQSAGGGRQPASGSMFSGRRSRSAGPKI